MSSSQSIKDETWMIIPGFRNYEVSNVGRVRKIDGTIVRCDKSKGCSLMRNGEQRYIRPPRLMYAAIHNIDPMDITGVLIIEENGQLKPVTRSEYVQKVTNVKRLRRNKPEEEHVERYYLEVILFSQLIIRYYENDDITEVANEINKYKEKIMVYMHMSHLSSDKKAMEEAWAEIICRTLSGIQKKTLTITTPYGYLKRAIRNYFSAIKRGRSLLVDFDDRKGMWIRNK